MTSIIKVDQIQTAAGATPTAGDLGIASTSGSVLQVHYLKFSTAVATNNTIYDIFNTTFTPVSSSSTLLLQTEIYMGATALYNLDGGIVILRDGSRVETGADSDAARGGNDVIDSMDDLWDADARSQWFRMKLGGTISVPANNTSESTYIVRFTSSSNRDIRINQNYHANANMRGISHFKITEIAG